MEGSGMTDVSKFILVGAFAVLAAAGPAAADKEEVPVDGPGGAVKDQGEAKRPGVFELVNRMLEVEVSVKGKKLTRETTDDMASKVGGARKDCFVQQIKANEKYRVRDDRIYRSKYVLSVKAEKGLYKKVSVDSSSGASPVIKACVRAVQGLETGYGDLNGMLSVTINTRLI
jgi:hypothetical protein